MKSLLLVSALAFSLNSFAQWTEKVECTVLRESVDTDEVSMVRVEAEMKMAGPHNGEVGSLIIKNTLAPSYTIKLEKHSGGRNDESTLTTMLGKRVMAKSTVDDAKSESVENKFITMNGDFQMTVSCTSKM